MSNQTIFHVSEFTQKVKFLLESELNTVWLTGEISNLVCASSGHWYLSLKDKKSQVRCAMFKMQNKRVRITPSNGQQVLIRAKVSLYEPRGDFQLIIELMEDAGEGLLRQKYQQLKQQLTDEGLFSHQLKKTMHQHYRTIGVITSPTGAAIRDVLTVLNRRNPLINVIIYPCLVQGTQAPSSITKAIELANKRSECEAIILTRGGGSLEDLWSFNEEIVVRAIANSQLPILSAVGHETDTTLADYASDLRAPTPSAGAEVISTDSAQLTIKLAQLQRQLSQFITSKTHNNNQQLDHLCHRLNRLHPKQTIMLQQQKFSRLAEQLSKIVQTTIINDNYKLNQLSHQLSQQSPQQKVTLLSQKRLNLKHQLTQAIDSKYKDSAIKYGNLIEQLNVLSPLATLSRGYSVLKSEDKKIIKSVNQISINDAVIIELSDGNISANVSAVSATDKMVD